MEFDDISRLFATHTPLADVALRFGAALLFALPTGIDRELLNKAAGLRTHLLVALAAAAFAVITLEFAHASTIDAAHTRLDPIRTLEAVITGIAFLGAGAIIRSQATVHGITTGASIWLAGAIGLACGIGSLAVAALLALVGSLVLSLLRVVERS